MTLPNPPPPLPLHPSAPLIIGEEIKLYFVVVVVSPEIPCVGPLTPGLGVPRGWVECERTTISEGEDCLIVYDVSTTLDQPGNGGAVQTQICPPLARTRVRTHACAHTRRVWPSLPHAHA